MGVAVMVEEELLNSGCTQPKSLQLQKTSLASVESLVMPLVQEVVLTADFQCAECQKRVADVISRMTEMESVVVNVLDKKVTLTCKYPEAVEVPSSIIKKSPTKLAMFMRLFPSSCC